MPATFRRRNAGNSSAPRQRAASAPRKSIVRTPWADGPRDPSPGVWRGIVGKGSLQAYESRLFMKKASPSMPVIKKGAAVDAFFIARRCRLLLRLGRLLMRMMMLAVMMLLRSSRLISGGGIGGD